MPASASRVRATGAYRKIQHESRAIAADPVELVAMIYDELETVLGVLVALARKGQPVSTTEPMHRARMMLIALDAGLDHRAGGDLAAALSRIYGSMRRKLDRLDQGEEVAVLTELLEGTRALSSAWNAIKIR